MYSLTEMNNINVENFVQNYGQYLGYYRWIYGAYGMQPFVSPLAAAPTTVASYQTEAIKEVQVNNNLGTFENQMASLNPTQGACSAPIQDQVDAATIEAAKKKVKAWILSSDFSHPVEETAPAEPSPNNQVSWPQDFSQERDLPPTPVSSAASVIVEKIIEHPSAAPKSTVQISSLDLINKIASGGQDGWNYFCWRCMNRYERTAVEKLMCKQCTEILNFQCQRCTKVFPLYTSMLGHRCHPVPKPRKTQGGSRKQVEDGYLQCEYCKFQSKSETGIKSHSSRIHYGSEVKYQWIRANDLALDLTVNSGGRSKPDEITAAGSSPAGLTAEYHPERGNSFQLQYCVDGKDQPKRYQQKYAPYGSHNRGNCFISKAQNFYQICN